MVKKLKALTLAQKKRLLKIVNRHVKGLESDIRQLKGKAMYVQYKKRLTSVMKEEKKLRAKIKRSIVNHKRK